MAGAISNGLTPTPGAGQVEIQVVRELIQADLARFAQRFLFRPAMRCQCRTALYRGSFRKRTLVCGHAELWFSRLGFARCPQGILLSDAGNL